MEGSEWCAGLPVFTGKCAQCVTTTKRVSAGVPAGFVFVGFVIQIAVLEEQ